MHRILPLAAACLALLVAVPNASATLYGVESNGETINSDRTPALQATALDKMKGQGAQVVRVNIGWNEVAGGCGGESHVALRNHEHACYNWRVIDSLVQQATDRRILVLASVSRAPRWLHDNDDPMYLGLTSRQWRHTVLHYSSFMRALATRYRPDSGRGYIRLFTVWNEPNSPNYLKPMHTSYLRRIVPARYAHLYAQSAIAIKQVNPRALVAPGPFGPIGNRRPPGIPPITFLIRFQRALPSFLPGTGARERQFINGWAHNPYPGLVGPPSRSLLRSPYVGMANIRDLIRQLDRAPITRGLRIWATEFGYQTNPPDRVFGTSLYAQGRYMAESFDWLDSTNRVTIAIWYGLTDPTNLVDWQSGTYFANGRAKPSLQWYRRPISVPANSARRGQAVRIWARSNVNPRGTRIAYSFNGRQWRLLPARGRKGDGTTVQYVRVFRRMWFSTWDGQRGPARVVSVRRR